MRLKLALVIQLLNIARELTLAKQTPQDSVLGCFVVLMDVRKFKEGREIKEYWEFTDKV